MFFFFSTQGDEALSDDRIELDNQLHVFEAVMNKDIAEVCTYITTLAISLAHPRLSPSLPPPSRTRTWCGDVTTTTFLLPAVYLLSSLTRKR